MESVAIKTGQGHVIEMTDEVTALRSALRGKLITEQDEAYESARRVWNGSIDKKPALIAQCEGTADVITSVRFAREHGLLLSIRAGGHNVSGASICDSGFVIDVSRMRSVHVNPQDRTALVESGATLGDLDRETTAFGLSAPVGVVSETGVAGLTLHGGMGWQLRKHGLSIDNLKAIEIVTADGEWKRTSAESYPDLFWALRGGGGNFGVVTAFEFNLHPVEPKVPFLMPIYPIEDSQKVLGACRDYMSSAPDEMMMVATFAFVPAAPELDEKDHGKDAVIILGCYSGSTAEAGKETDHLREISRPIGDLSAAMEWKEIQSLLDEDYPEGMYYYWKSIYLDRLDDEVIKIMDEFARERPSKETTIDIWFLGGQMNRIPSDATAFVNRKSHYAVGIEANWHNEAESQANIEWARELYEALKPYSGGGIYLNFPGYVEEKEAMLRGAYGDNMDKLVEVKNKYDPDNLFPGLLNIASKISVSGS